MVRPDRDRIGGAIGIKDHVEVDETYIGGSIRGEGRGPHSDEKSIVIAAVEVRTRPPKKGDKPSRNVLVFPLAAPLILAYSVLWRR